MDFSVSQINPLFEYGMRLIDGFGNYRLRVYGASGSLLSNSTVFDLFFLDSGDREIVHGKRTYGWIKESQLRWLQDTSKQVNRFKHIRSFIYYLLPLKETH